MHSGQDYPTRWASLIARESFDEEVWYWLTHDRHQTEHEFYSSKICRLVHTHALSVQRRMAKAPHSRVKSWKKGGWNRWTNHQVLQIYGATNCSKFMASISYSSIRLCVHVVQLVVDLNFCRRRLKCLLLLNPIPFGCKWGVPTKPVSSKQSSSLHTYLLPWPHVLVINGSCNS